MIRPLSVLLIAFSLSACTAFRSTQAPSRPAPAAATSAVTPAEPDLKAYRLGIGDRLRVNVFGETDLSLEATVDGTGHISYPLLGSVLAMRKTADELAKDISVGLAAGYLVNPDVRVTVTQYRAFYVIGQVQHAGSYPYVVGLTVEKALALAGGLTAIASTRKIYLLHEDMPAEKRMRVSMDTVVLPGDTLVVEESLF